MEMNHTCTYPANKSHMQYKQKQPVSTTTRIKPQSEDRASIILLNNDAEEALS